MKKTRGRKSRDTVPLMKTSETKKFVKIFCEAFLIFKNILLQPSRTYFNFYKKGYKKFPSSED
jgi:hypothetical protein